MSGEPYLLPNGRVLRYSFRERLVHWLAGVSYVYLLLTGLAFWSPWLFWIAVILGGATISRELHPWFGLAFMVGVSLMYSMWHRQMKETPSDKAWWGSIGHYIRNEDDQTPSADRFNPGQKLLFWGFFWNGIVLLLSGLILWLPQYIPCALSPLSRSLSFTFIWVRRWNAELLAPSFAATCRVPGPISITIRGMNNFFATRPRENERCESQ